MGSIDSETSKSKQIEMKKYEQKAIKHFLKAFTKRGALRGSEPFPTEVRLRTDLSKAVGSDSYKVSAMSDSANVRTEQEIVLCRPSCTPCSPKPNGRFQARRARDKQTISRCVLHLSRVNA